MTDFLGLAAVIIDSMFKREIVVIGIDRMPGGHNAENLSLVIESIVNRFEFDKFKIKGKFDCHYITCFQLS